MFQLSWQKVLVPYDLSDPATETLKQTLGAAGDEVEVHVLHVIEPAALMDPYAVWVDVPHDDEQAAREAIDRKLAEAGITCHDVVLRRGQPAVQITEYADEIGADAILIPTHGRTGATRLLIGSVTERVVRLAPCPVLVLRLSND